MFYHCFIYPQVCTEKHSLVPCNPEAETLQPLSLGLRASNYVTRMYNIICIMCIYIYIYTLIPNIRIHVCVYIYIYTSTSIICSTSSPSSMLSDLSALLRALSISWRRLQASSATLLVHVYIYIYIYIVV